MNVVDNVWYEEKRGQWSVDKRKHSGVKGNSDETYSRVCKFHKGLKYL